MPEDDQDELKGVALRCNWPDHLSIPDLLQALTRRRRPSLVGTYAVFLSELDQTNFAAAGHLFAGLRWAREQVSDLGDSDILHRIAMRIAHSALQHLDSNAVARELTHLLLRWATWQQSPLHSLGEDPLQPRPPAARDDEAPLRRNRGTRRRLIDLLVRAVEPPQGILELEHLTPGLRDDEDFLWLLRKGCDRRRRMNARRNYLHLAWLLPWWDRSENVEAWLRVCDDEAVRSILGNRKSVDLDSQEAEQLRKRWKLLSDPPKTNKPPLDPPPHERVLRLLDLAGTKDVRYFRGLCTALALEPNSTRQNSTERFLTKMPGWLEVDEETRDRIVAVAKAYLSGKEIASEAASGVAPNVHHVDVLGAMWLVLEVDAGWLRSRPEQWWNDWCWYILRELIPNLFGEPVEPKRQLLALLSRKSPTGLCREIAALARQSEDGHQGLLADLLPMLADEPHALLDETLRGALRAREIAEPNAGAVAEFVLTRDPHRATPLCLDLLDGAPQPTGDTLADHLAVALLCTRAGEAWESLRTFLRFPEERGRRILAEFARKRESGLPSSLSTRQLGELAELFIEVFPFETDPGLDRTHVVAADESARTLRSHLISHLVGLEQADAVDALRRIECRFSRRYPWLTQPRSDAERALRLSRWTAFPVGTVDEVIEAGMRRLIRSEQDAVDGIECALEGYETALRRDSGQSPEDLWNTPTGEAPTPKAEEHVSSKLCATVRTYFEKYAVTADREVKIIRRSVARDRGGEPGSEVDVLVQAPARGTTHGDPIRIPIEVKLSSNNEAKTGMRDQLADRYMPQLGASHGVYVVVWMSVPPPEGLRASHRPRWRSMKAAREDLRRQAELVSKERKILVRPVVLDGSLR